MFYESLIFESAIINMYYFSNQKKKTAKKYHRFNTIFLFHKLSYGLDLLPAGSSTLVKDFEFRS